jgi:hypothetical protein
MANNFHIFSHKTTESLHIKLTGDFDGSSASELINALADSRNKYYQIFIDTSELKNIHPFGQKVLENRLSEFGDKDPGVIFIGKNIVQSLELN